MTRAFTVIFVASVIVWFLQSFSIGLQLVDDPADSMLAMVGSWFAPVFAPLGFGDWRLSTALIAGFMAKEVVDSTSIVLFGDPATLQAAMTPLACACLLAFCLLYTPCIAAVEAVRRELGVRWALGVVVFQCAIAWLVAFAIRIVGMAFGLG